MDYLPLPGTPVEEIDTPAIIVDLDIAEANVGAMSAFASENGVNLRPHMKTGKSPYWALKQIEAGAIGVCAAKVGEAEILAEGGVREILVTNQIVGQTKIRRLFGVASRANVTVAVDSHENVAELSDAAQAFGRELGVILEVETGMERAGVEPGEAATTLAQAVDRAPGLRFDGVMGYEGGAVYTEDFDQRKREALETLDKLLSAVDDIEAADTEPASSGRDNSGHRAQRSRLPGPVRPDQPKNLAGGDGEGQIIDGSEVAIVLMKVGYLDHARVPP